MQSGPDVFDTSRYFYFKTNYDLFNHLGRYRNIMQFQISSRRETGKEIPESSRLEFLEKFSANNFALSDVEDIADLPLLRTLLAIHQKSQEPRFWEVMDYFVLLAYASLAASRTLLQQLLACLKFTLEAEDLSFHYKRKK